MILVTGSSGQLGYDVCKTLKRRKIEYIGTTRKELDFTDYNMVKELVEKIKPSSIIHCGAYTAVDKAEDEENKCYEVNVKGTENIARACKENNVKLIYISTDYIFSGNGNIAYEVDDETAPLGIYGESKLQGENKVKELLDKYFIVRISWVFGINGNNFVKTMLKLGKERMEINVVSDQIGSPTYTVDVANLLCDMIATEKYGTYHATNEGFCSWAEFAEEIFRLAGYDTKVNYITTDKYPTRAKRPKNSRLSKIKVADNFYRLPTWEIALDKFIKELKESGLC
ncbi:MAG: dTDP-4-dehydrorhamnose reductase [Erysipelotrichia bacterium]|nr:dTDP-4-dehydrorhamnose reductase [Erysipelotrichia bacterium]